MTGCTILVLLLCVVLALFHRDPTHNPFAGFEQYMPGQPKPQGCFPIAYEPSQWECKIGDIIDVGGYSATIQGTTFLFTGVRLGDVYAVLGRPETARRLTSGVWRMSWRQAFLYASSADPSKPVYNITFWEMK